MRNALKKWLGLFMASLPSLLLSTMVLAADTFVISKNTRGNVEFTPVLQIDQNANSGSTVKYIEVGGLKFSPTDESKAKPDLMAGVRAEVKTTTIISKNTRLRLSHAHRHLHAMSVPNARKQQNQSSICFDHRQRRHYYTVCHTGVENRNQNYTTSYEILSARVKAYDINGLKVFTLKNLSFGRDFQNSVQLDFTRKTKNANWTVSAMVGEKLSTHYLETSNISIGYKFRPDVNMADTVTVSHKFSRLAGTEVFGVERKGTRKQTSILAQKTILKTKVNYGVTYSENKSSVSGLEYNQLAYVLDIQF